MSETERQDSDISIKWKREQQWIKGSLILSDTEPWQRERQLPTYVAGVDVSFVKERPGESCAALIVCSMPTLEVVYEDLQEVFISEPYIPGYLAFREAEPILSLLNKLKEQEPELYPQVILFDGNGILHPNGCGVASHVGALCDTPAIGVAKKLFHVDGLENSAEHKQKIDALEKGGDTFPLIGDSGNVLGMALRSCDEARNVVYVSQGHRTSLDTAVWVVRRCCDYRNPEPIRQADIRSREHLRQKYPPPTPQENPSKS